MNRRLSTIKSFLLEGRAFSRTVWKIPAVGLVAVLVATLMATTAAADHLPPFGLSQAWEATAARYMGAAATDELTAFGSNRAWEASAARYSGLAALQGASMDSSAEWAGFYATEIASRSGGRAAKLDVYDGMAASYDAAVRDRLSIAALSTVDKDWEQTSCARSRDGSVDVYTLGYPTGS